jgi:N-acetylglucosaminyldiphosphoundecaprenol N-acetyl-beta-D-mannosaminyltransferase
MIEQSHQDGSTHQIATVNVDFLVNAQHDPQVAEILRDADMCLADGVPIVWASRFVRDPLPERVAGSDLVPMLISQSATRGWRIHVFGSSPSVASRARAKIDTLHPDATVTLDPGPRIPDPEVVDEAVLASIEAAEADVLCVALGNPKQERFIRAHRARLGIPVLIGVGGSLDMFVGERKRAPRWVQTVGLEWVYRAMQEPTRLGPRYARDLRAFLPMLWTELGSRRTRRNQ